MKNEEEIEGGTKDGQEPRKSSGSTRRDFLRSTGMGAAGGVVALTLGGSMAASQVVRTARANPQALTGGKLQPAVPMATGRALGANDRINLGYLGVGGQGGSHVHLFTRDRAENNINSIAVCDVYEPRLARARQAIAEADTSLQIQSERDYRRLLENPAIDAIVISTPEHWHAQMALDAMQAGKHVYIEKPFTRYLDEAFQVKAMQERTGMVTQIGSQGCSDPKWWTAGEAVRAGRIGQLVSSQGSYARNSREGEWNYGIHADAGPQNLDWKMWLGSAPDRPWNDDARERFFRYRKYRDYSAGLLGDLMPHKMHPLMIALFLHQPQFPSRVTTMGTRNVSTDREVSDTVHVAVEFPEGHTMYVFLTTVNEQGIEDMIRGHQATLRFGGDRVRLSPERPYSEDIDAAEIPIPGRGGESVVAHEKDWLNCIRTGKKPNCDIDLALRVQTIVSLAEMSEVKGRTIDYDASRQRITL